jgi:hypothetical protein
MRHQDLSAPDRSLRDFISGRFMQQSVTFQFGRLVNGEFIDLQTETCEWEGGALCEPFPDKEIFSFCGLSVETKDPGYRTMVGAGREVEKSCCEQIKRFAHSKKTAGIQAYGEQHFRIGGGFALNRPVSIFGLISDGIKYFSKQTSLGISIILTVSLTELSYQ